MQSSGSREVFTILSTKIFTIIVALLTQGILARVLLPEGRGAYAVCIMFATLFPVLFTPGADRATQYFVMRKEMTLSAGVAVGARIVLVGSFLAFIVAQPLIYSKMGLFDKANSSTFQLAMLIMPLSIFDTVLKLQLGGLRRFNKLGLFAICESIALVVGIGFFAWYLSGSVDGAIVGMVFAYLVSISLSMIDLVKNCGLRFEKVNFNLIFKTIDYGRKYYVARVGNMADFSIGVLTLAFFATQYEIGLFAAASALTMRVFIISNSIESFLLPRVANDTKGCPDLVGQSVRLSGAITCMLLLLLVAVSEPLVRILLSELFLPSVSVIFILAPGIFIYAASKVLLIYFQGVGRPEICSYALLLGLPITVLLTVLLYPYLEITAAAWAMTASFLLRSVFLAIVFKKISGQGYLATWLPRRDDWAPLFRSLKNRFGRDVS